MIAKLRQNSTAGLRIAFLAIFALVLFGSLFASYIIRKDRTLQNRLYPNVYLDGRDVGGKTRDEAMGYFRGRERNLKKTVIHVTYRNTPVATFSASRLNLRTNIDEAYTKAYLVGRTPHYPSRIYQKAATLLGLDRFSFNSQVQYDKTAVRETIDLLEEAYNKPAENALFKFENNRAVSFRKETKGNRILSEELMTDLDQALRSQKFKQESYTITLKEETVQPEVTLAKANGFGIEELIGEGVSNYSHSIPGRIHNVILAASKFNGVLIPKGSKFSFNETVGDISASTGYQPAYIIKEGKTVLGDGGGVCQVSTTLFRAALNSGLPITERFPHAYRVSYYENDSKPGLDATVFAPGVDLKIENNTPSAILIQTEVDEENMLLYFRLYGKKDDRNVELTTPVLYDVAAPPPDVRQDDPTLKRGVVKQVDFAAWGGKASFDYKVTRGGQVLFEKKFFSAYKPWAAVYLVGTQD